MSRDELVRMARRNIAHVKADTIDQTPDVLRVPAANYTDPARFELERERVWKRTPLVLAPVSAVPPYEIGFDVESRARTEQVWRECSTLMAVPVLGLPGMAVPTGLAGGLPVGVQIVGPRFREDLCLAAAEAIEARAAFAAGLPIDPR